MKAVIPSKPFSDVMKTVAKALAPESASLPALTHVLVDADGSLHLTATDLEVCLQVPVAGVVERGGAAVVPGRILANTVTNMAGPVTLESDGHSLVVSARGTEATLPCLDPADFPTVAPGEPAPLAVLPAAELGEAARHVASAADPGSPRAFATGVWLRFEEGEPDVAVLAADGYRLAVRRVAALRAPGQTVDLLVPAAAVPLLGAFAGAVTVGATENHAVFDDGAGTVLHASRIEATLPDVEGIFPKGEPALRVTAPARELAAALKAVQGFNRALLTLHLDGELRLSAEGAEVGRSAVAVKGAVIHRNGDGGAEETAAVHLRPAYLRDVLRGVKGDVTLKVWGAERPVLFVGPAGEDLVMPMQKE